MITCKHTQSSVIRPKMGKQASHANVSFTILLWSLQSLLNGYVLLVNRKYILNIQRLKKKERSNESVNCWQYASMHCVSNTQIVCRYGKNRKPSVRHMGHNINVLWAYYPSHSCRSNKLQLLKVEKHALHTMHVHSFVFVYRMRMVVRDRERERNIINWGRELLHIWSLTSYHATRNNRN